MRLRVQSQGRGPALFTKANVFENDFRVSYVVHESRNPQDFCQSIQRQLSE